MKKLLFSFLWISCSLGQALQEGFQKEQELERFEENVIIAEISSYAIPATLGFLAQGSGEEEILQILLPLYGSVIAGTIGVLVQDEINDRAKVDKRSVAAKACFGNAIRMAVEFAAFYFAGALIRKSISCAR